MKRLLIILVSLISLLSCISNNKQQEDKFTHNSEQQEDNNVIIPYRFNYSLDSCSYDNALDSCSCDNALDSCSCDNEEQEEDKPTFNNRPAAYYNEAIPQGFEWTRFYAIKEDQRPLYIKYKQKVNGYDVSVMALYFVGVNDDLEPSAYIHFQKDGEYCGTIKNDYFSFPRPDDETLNKGVFVESDYTPFVTPEEDNELYGCQNSPFFFRDVDFDGKEELIITLFGGLGYHENDAYKAYNVDEDYTYFTPMQEPFDLLSSYTTFDASKRTITTPYGYDLKFTGHKIYGEVTHTVFDWNTNSLKEQKSIELIEIFYYDWKHTEGIKYIYCDPNIYHYKIINGNAVLSEIEKCPNDSK